MSHTRGGAPVAADDPAWFVSWLRGRRADPDDRRRPEQHFPDAVVALHGLGAALTFVLVLLAALD